MQPPWGRSQSKSSGHRAKKASKRGRLCRTMARFRAWMASPCRSARAARNSLGPELEMEV